ncbi:MAG: hypothetical protein H7X95_00280 [Deltaproteobacteria bacterium]|nr:hypothetical protein [Deltaproteobacteria bacterium]
MRFAYVLLSVNLIQVYRDGLLSIVVFTFVNMMPLVIIVILHVAFSANPRRHRVNLPGFLAPAGLLPPPDPPPFSQVKDADRALAESPSVAPK